MSWWSWLTGVNHQGEIPNANPPSTPSTVGAGEADGDTDGFEIVGETVQARALPSFFPSPWAGWPSDWSTPNWDMGSRFNTLVDVAWTCLDKNSSALSTMPVYRTRDGKVIAPTSWMTNPDPSIYSSWEEFAKQLFWDFQSGEVFIMQISSFADGFPSRFRVIPGWAIHAEMSNGVRRYRLGGPTGPDVTGDILHIRYKSTTDSAHGTGPLEQAGGRMLMAGVTAKYMREVVESGGIPVRTIEATESLTSDEAQMLMDQYMASRVANASAPPVFDNGATLKSHPAVSPKEMAMLELAQFNESRIAVLLGVPPFLVGLPSGGDSMTYSNVSSLFDFHDRQTLRTLALHVMSAISFWALPAGQKAELNRDEYSRPSFDQRADAWVKLVTAGIVTSDEVRRAERLMGGDETAAITAITGGEE
jgi:HK97 family phage portal protein